MWGRNAQREGGGGGETGGERVRWAKGVRNDEWGQSVGWSVEKERRGAEEREGGKRGEVLGGHGDIGRPFHSCSSGQR